MLLRAIRLFAMTCFLFMLSQCANPFAPTGGPKDTSPPIALVSPKDTIVNYAGERLIWAFDEYIQPIQKQNIHILPEAPISIKQRGRSVILSIDEITRGVAYNLLVKDAIKDYNEGNIFPPQSLWITTYGVLPSNSILYSTTILPPNRNLTTFSASIQSDNPTLIYSLLEKDRLEGRLDHLQTSRDYTYKWYWDTNSNGTVDSFERHIQLSLSFDGSNEIIIHSPLRKPIGIDSLTEDFFTIFPKPDQYTWDSIVEEKGFTFSTYDWGHDTVYASTKDVKSSLVVDSSQRLILASLNGTHSSDTLQALILVADTTLDDKNDTNRSVQDILYLPSIPSRDLDSLNHYEGSLSIHTGLYFVTFSLPSDTIIISDNLNIEVFNDDGAILFSDLYREGSIYSFYGEPSYAIFTSSAENNKVLFYVDRIDVQQDFLVTEILQSTETIKFIND